MDYKFTIIVPVYNEEDNIERLEKELVAYLELALVSTKILIINDGSTDASQSLIEAICHKHFNFDYVLFEKNQGLSAALKAGFDLATTELVGYIDADLQTSPKDFNLLLEYSSDYDLVTGVRLNRKDHFIKKLSSKIANRIRRLFTQDGMDDTGCPLKVIKTEYAKRIIMFKGLHRFLPALVLLQNGRIKQVPVNHFPRIAGTSKYGLRKRLFAPLADCFAYVWMKKRMLHYKIAKKSF
ncbi:glycosyltransferase family 2 protein [Psychroserpens sp. SPM9]|uniref:glycosyltransferase family 2 protein n=1 Tax=Psychroserpens sp. SPM9 TaxID=2975598 RepID=UPI0021A8ABB9|nr:glycosyltransferase family 2 protein [Psychroserpens sp. SPM9]MDG5492283.1 glycosyltransferase family 2 protein [Psychroserpens sp. SPM9]